MCCPLNKNKMKRILTYTSRTPKSEAGNNKTVQQKQIINAWTVYNQMKMPKKYMFTIVRTFSKDVENKCPYCFLLK